MCIRDSPNALLELKTKSNHVEHLLELPHGGKTVISWSVNPQAIITKEELKTSNLDERIKAARISSEAGYKVAFHFDPMIDYPDWEKGIRDWWNRLLTIFPQRELHGSALAHYVTFLH